jgi:mannitol/fructose-specific phosphotransferase system IIA component (Ntr-type)/galactitol-specific phosphotransferase system IIB component
MQYELIRLLTSEEPLLVKQLQSALDVSRTTVRRDLAEVEEWLVERNLALWSRPHVGIHLSGSELSLRSALVELLCETLSVDELLSFFQSGNLRRIRVEGMLPQKAARSYIATLNLTAASSRMWDECKRRGLADSELVGIFLYSAISERRICSHRFAHLPEQQIDCIRDHWAFGIARRWCEDVAARCGVSILDDEAAALAARVVCARRARFSIEWDTAIEPDVSEEIAAAVDAILLIASQRLHPFLRIDSLLGRGIALHLVPALQRIRFGLPLNNTLKDEIQTAYPGVYSIALECSESVEQITGVSLPRDEVAFLTMHLGAAIERLRARPTRRILVVCGEGIATAWLLVSRLRSVFPFIDVVDVMSVRELHNRFVQGMWIDVIVSTVDLDASNAPVVVVSPLLNSRDVTKVSEALNAEPISGAWPVADFEDQGGPSLGKLVKAFRLQSTAVDWEQATRQAGDLLVSFGIAEPRYVDAMIALIRRHGPYMVVAPGIALLHALPGEGALRLGMSLVTLRDPVRFGHESNDPVNIVFAFACVETHRHLQALGQLVALLDNASAVETLAKASEASEVYRLLQQANSIQ